MHARTFLLITAIYALLSALLIGWADRPLAAAVHAAAPAWPATGAAVTAAMEWLLGIPLSKYFAMAALAAAGVALHLRDRDARRARGLYFVGGTLYLTWLACGALKDVFGRARPHEFLAAGADAPDFFVAGAHAFPSGHAAFYFGALLPAALLLPRWRWPLLALAAAGALARVLEGAHYLSDVVASAYLALLVSLLLTKVLRMDLHPRDRAEQPGADAALETKL